MLVKEGDYVRHKSNGRVMYVFEVRPRKKQARVAPNAWVDFDKFDPASEDDYYAQKEKDRLEIAEFQLKFAEDRFDESVEDIASTLERLAETIRRDLSRYKDYDRENRNPHNFVEYVQSHVLGSITNLQLPYLPSRARDIVSAQKTLQETRNELGETEDDNA